MSKSASSFSPLPVTRIIVAVFSIVMGATLGTLFLALKPVVKLAADVELGAPAPDVVYCFEGKRENERTPIASDTYNRFLSGFSVKVDEIDLNALRLTEFESSGSFYKISAPSFRLRDDQLQIGVSMHLYVYGYLIATLVQTRGTFVRKGGIFAFDPQTMWIGSCPVHRLPLLGSPVMDKVIGSQTWPETVVTAWTKLSEVRVSDSSLSLTVQ